MRKSRSISGRQTKPAVRFELSGGHPALDFANTVDNRGAQEPVELFRGYSNLLAWARQSRLISENAARTLAVEARRNPAASEAALCRACSLRESLYSVFSASARHDSLPQDEIALVNEFLPDAMSHLRLVPGRDRVEWAWSEERSLDSIAWRIARSAADLLTTDDLPLVRECAADTCGWLFLDRSRNRTRRWCDMNVCGNRAKVRRHYLKIKKQA